MIEIDGSLGEGGGQILRTLLALSTITQKPIRIYNIRANRPNPGLRPQHLTVVKAFQKVADAEVKGAEVGSREIFFTPSDIKEGRYVFDVGTAGSVTLLAQALIPALINTRSELVLRGGTHVKWSPTYDYFENVFVPAIRRMGVDIHTNIIRYGFYPHGGGEIKITVKPSSLKAFQRYNKNEKEYGKVRGVIVLSNLPGHVARRERKVILSEFNEVEDIKIREVEALDPGNSITLWKGFVGADVLGEKGVRAEEVAKKVCTELKDQFDFDVDVHLSDQLLIYMALAGKSELYVKEITSHAKTNAKIIEKFLDIEFKFEKYKDGWIVKI